MAVSDAFKRKVAKIEDRDWDAIEDVWGQSLDAAAMPGTAPGHEIHELPSLPTFLDRVSQAPSHPLVLDEGIAGLRASILKEGVFGLQKCALTLRAAETSYRNAFGYPTLPISYQAAMYGARAIINLLGVCAHSRPGTVQHYMWDCVSGRVSGSRDSVTGPRYHYTLLETGCSVDHQELWYLLTRILHKVKLRTPI